MDSNNSSAQFRRYDVFLSFRGTDTRNTFTDHLYHHLLRKGIFVFKDDLNLERGELISTQLLHAIQDSRVSIVIFSKDYVASSWCLEEMAAIADCHNQLKQTVIPVFYDVNPSHVRKQYGNFSVDFYLHFHKRFKHDPSKVEQWKIAMTQLGNLAGFEGTNNVKAIVLDQKENLSNCRAEGFSNMRNLRLLMLYHTSFTGHINFLSNNLQFLLWHGYPFTSLPSNFEPNYLVELNMPDSSIQRLWEDRSKDFPYLKRMDLSNSKYLIETPKFNWAPKLERLDFTGCTNLSEVHPSSIGDLTELAFLSLQNCSSLVNLDFGSVSNLSCLRVLRLSGCTKLEKTPDFSGASNLEYLDMDGCTSLSTVHESVGVLAKLRFFSLRNCTNLVGIPNSINTMVISILRYIRFVSRYDTKSNKNDTYLSVYLFCVCIPSCIPIHTVVSYDT